MVRGSWDVDHSAVDRWFNLYACPRPKVSRRFELIDISALGLKYLCPYTGLNSIGLTGMSGVGDAEGYYKDPGTWAPGGSQNTTSSLPGYDLGLTCSTSALSGASDQFYQFDVHIGLEPQSNGSAVGQRERAVSLEKPPGKAPILKPGDTVRLPNGKTGKVVNPAKRVKY